MIREHLSDRLLLTDGAMGTYFSETSGRNVQLAEEANLVQPERIEAIHREYLAAGAKLVRTNTFSANTRVLGVARDKLREILLAGYRLAERAVAGQDAFVAANIGPVPEAPEEDSAEDVLAEYRFILDTFLEAGATVFNLETFSSTRYLPEIARHVKAARPEAFLLAQFAATPRGETRKGIALPALFAEVRRIPELDACGLNCGVGPAHTLANLKRIDRQGLTFACLPNAGFPELVNERTVYSNNPDYFALLASDMARAGVRILGGCCGTTPRHVRALADRLLGGRVTVAVSAAPVGATRRLPPAPAQNPFFTKLARGQSVTAVELDPPHSADASRLDEALAVLRHLPVDVVTVADSPSGKVRASALVTALRFRRDTGLPVMPHFCCRDRNLIGLKADLLAAYLEGIRNVLCVTGDPIPREERNEIKSVFNGNSLSLLGLVQGLNASEFAGDPLRAAAALNPMAANLDALLARTEKKVKAGAELFLTQPLFEERALETVARVRQALGVKVLAGILPLVSLRNALFLNNEFPGIRIPEGIIGRFAEGMSRPDAEGVGVAVAAEMGRQAAAVADGLYLITPFFRAAMIGAVIAQLQPAR